MNTKLKFIQKNILVVGDVMLDCYLMGNVKRISPEAPVPVFLRNGVQYVLGGAANVVANLVAAEQNVFLATVVGDDKNAATFINMVSSIGCNIDCVVRSSDRSTTIKTRIVAQNNQQLLRIDEEQIDSISVFEEENLVSSINGIINKIDIIVISDYLKGVLTSSLVQEVIKIAQLNGIPVFVDIKDKNIEKYQGATLLKPNRNELSMTTGMPVNTLEEVLLAAQVLLEKSRSSYVLATMGSKGMVLVSKDNKTVIPSLEREVYDVSGAGDTVISYLSTAFANGYKMIEAATIANIAAGVKVTKFGTSPVFIQELVDEFQDQLNIDERGRKIVSKNELVYVLSNLRDKRIVFTNGCFDIIHKGHVHYLRKAAELGDLLIVGLNSDSSVKRLKGNNRPINSQDDRAEVLAALVFVDYVVIFSEDTPINLIETIRPDILVKGSDYNKTNIAGAEFVENCGGRVELIQILDGYSTTNIIKKWGDDNE